MAKKVNLTKLQRLWADYWIKTGNGTEAARLAGYKGNDNVLAVTAANNLKNEKIKKYIAETYEQTEKAADDKRVADSMEVLEFLTKTMRGEVKDQFGLDPMLSDRIKAAELLGKRYGLFREVQQNMEYKNPFKDLSTEQLVALAEADADG